MPGCLKIAILVLLCCLTEVSPAQLAVLPAPLMLKKDNLVSHGQVKTGALISLVKPFKYDSVGYKSHGISSFQLRYYNKTVLHNKLNIFIGVRDQDLATVMIPDLNYDQNFTNDTVLVFSNTTGLPVDSVNKLLAALEPFKINMPVKANGGVTAVTFFLRLIPRTYLSYSTMHPAKTRQDSLYIMGDLAYHCQSGFRYKQDSFTVAIQDVSFDTTANTLGAGNMQKALVKIAPVNGAASNSLVVPANELALFYNSYMFKATVVDDYNKVNIQVYRQSPNAQGIFPGQFINLLTGTDIITHKVYSTKSREKNTLLFFWFVGCGPCHEVMPQLSRLAREKGDSLAMLSICTAGSKEHVLEDINRFGINYPVLDQLTTKGKRWDELFKVQEYPMFILISKSGKIICRTESIDEAEKSLY